MPANRSDLIDFGQSYHDVPSQLHESAAAPRYPPTSATSYMPEKYAARGEQQRLQRHCSQEPVATAAGNGDAVSTKGNYNYSESFAYSYRDSYKDRFNDNYSTGKHAASSLFSPCLRQFSHMSTVHNEACLFLLLCMVPARQAL